jgi:two-component system OmpR family response regulator
MTDRGSIVVVEDDPAIGRLVAMYLEADGFDVDLAADGVAGLTAARRPATVMAVVDLGLPGGLDGLEVCRRIRSAGDLPVVILTAKRSEDDRVAGLELGADDYVTKPFSPRELVARVHAVLRRSTRSRPEPESVLVAGDVEVDLGRYEARVAGAPVALTPREYELLAFLARHAGAVMSRAQILDGAWGPGWYGDDRTVDVHVRQLRAKLGEHLALTTVRGVGYRLG